MYLQYFLLIFWRIPCLVGEYIYLYRYLPVIEVWRSLHSRTLQYQMVSSNQLCDRPSSILGPCPCTVIIPGVFSTPTSGSLGCLLARQLCLEDSACNQVLQVIPRVCGLELGEIFIFIFLHSIQFSLQNDFWHNLTFSKICKRKNKVSQFEFQEL